MDSVQGQMLAGVIGTFNRQLDRITLSEAPAHAAGITQLVRALLLDGVNEETAPAVDDARQAAIRTPERGQTGVRSRIITFQKTDYTDA
jgi:hypothetical protein